MPTLAAYRADFGDRHNARREITTGVFYGAAYTGTPTGTNARRLVVSSDLASMNRAGASGEAPGASANYEWTYVPSTGEQMRVVENGFTSYATASSVLTGNVSGSDAEIVGYLIQDRNLAVALPPDTLVETGGRFPTLPGQELPSLHWAINEALQVMHWPYKLPIPGDGTKRYEVSALAPWLKRQEQLIRVFLNDPDDGTGPQPMQGKVWLEQDGQYVYLHVPQVMDVGQTFYAQVRRPCNTWIKVGAWRDSTVGLVNENDEALPEVNRVTPVAWWQLCTRMAERGPSAKSDGWATAAVEAEKDAAPFVEDQPDPGTPQRRYGYAVPRHPRGKAWVATGYGGIRRWPVR